MSKLQFEGEDEEELGKLAVRLANSIILPMALKLALELNLIEIMAGAGDGALLSPSEIAAQLPARNPDAPVLLDRVLRLLASYSILKCSLWTLDNGEVERLYGVGPICKFLTRNPDGGSIGPLFLLHHDKVFMESWYYTMNFFLFLWSFFSIDKWGFLFFSFFSFFFYLFIGNSSEILRGKWGFDCLGKQTQGGSKDLG